MSDPKPAPKRIGYCIYCGSTDTLSNEHIIPEGLGGRDILLDASCEICRVETCKFENHVLRRTIHIVRIRWNVRGKRKHPGTVPMLVRDQNGQYNLEEVAPDDVTISAMLPRFTEPGVLIGAAPHDRRPGQLTFYGSPMPSENLRKAGTTGLMGLPITPIDFTRMIAKIAHAAAVNHIGLEAFEPFLGPSIRKRLDEIYYYVGCDCDENPEPHPIANGTWVELAQFARPNETLLLGRVGVLTGLPDAPIYKVVIGRLVAPIV